MYTQCPECTIAFRVTAKVLQQAAGNVRCGNCGHTFSALQYLSEEMPGQASSAPSGAADEEPLDELAETSRRLLQTLDELAGPDDVRIEDTGVEWQVLDDVAAADVSLAPDEMPAEEEIRYDDNTPLPEDFDDGEMPAPAPQRREEDRHAVPEEFEDRQGDLALSEPEDWTDILEEVRDPDSESLEVEEELAAIHNELSAIDEALTDEVLHLNEEGIESTDADDEDELEADLVERIEMGAEAELAAQDTLMDASAGDGDEVEDEETGSFEAVNPEFEDADNEAAAGEGAEDADEAAAFDREPTGEFDAQIDEAARALADDGASDAEYAVDELDDVSDEETDADEESDDEAGEMDEFEDDFAAVASSAELTEDEAEADEETDDETEEEAHEEAEADEETDDETEEEAHEEADTDDETGEEAHEEADADDETEEENEAELEPASDRELDFAATLVGMKNPEELFDESSGEVETIIMEGEFIHNEIEQERIAAEHAARNQLDDSSKLLDTYAMQRGKVRGGRRSYDPPSTTMLVAIVALGLLFAVQLMHNFRQPLATHGFFNATIAPIYRMLGSPITPDWNILGWQFEATNGSVEDEQNTLVIATRIANRSSQSLPYPLVHVSLTNRFEDVIGSRILEPGEYLADNGDPSRLVEPGQNFDALITVEEATADATGFKLYVCYRIEPGSVRCANEDFKN